MTSCAKKNLLTAFFFGSTALWLGLAGLNWSNLSIMELGLLPWLDCPWLVWLTLLMPRSWMNLRYDLNFNFPLSDKLYMWYSLMSIRQNYNFDMSATIWHEIVSWFLTIFQDLRNMITKLFCTDMKIKTKTIYWSSCVNPGKSSEIN